MEKTYYVEASRHEVNEFFIENEKFRKDYRPSRDVVMPEYNRMVKWMDDKVKDYPIKSVKIEITEGQDMIIIGHNQEDIPVSFRIMEDKELVKKEEKPFEEVFPYIPVQAKGYDLGQDAYVYTVVDTWRAIRPYKAESAEKALEMAAKDRLDETLKKVMPYRQMLHEDLEHRVTLQDGRTVEIHNEYELMRQLKEKFPNGMTIRLADENFGNLQDFHKSLSPNSNIELTDWMGLGNPGNTEMLVSHGPLKAELHLKPEDYGYIGACTDTYFDEDLEEIFEDNGVVATSLMLNEEKEMDAFRVVIPKVPVMADRLYVEDIPFRELMEMAKTHKVKNTEEMQFVIQGDYIKQQPEWLRNLAHQQTMPQRHKLWVRFVAEPVAEYHKAYDKAFDDAAQKYGFKNAETLKQAMEITNIRNNKLAGTLMDAATYIHKQCKPFKQKEEQAQERFERLKVFLDVEFVKNFRKFSQKNVKDVTLYPGNQQQWFVRCSINGEKQMGIQLQGDDAKFKKGDNLKELALKYFKDDITESLSQTQKQHTGLKR